MTRCVPVVGCARQQAGLFCKRLAERYVASNRSRAANDRQLSLLEWGRKFLPDHFAKPSSKLHRWLGCQLNNAERGRKINLIGPRGAAKSTIGTLTFVLRVALQNREPYTWIISDTKPQAQTHLENVKLELAENEQLAEAYPDATGRGPRWRSTAIKLNNGVVIESYGTGQRIRGRRRRANRPTLIVCDDLQNESHMVSPERRRWSREWFHGTLLKAGNRRTIIVNLATALHREALALELHRTPGWASAIFRSIETWPDRMDLWQEWEQIYSDVVNPDSSAAAAEFYRANRSVMHQGAELLWPEEENLYSLMQMRVESGRTAFEREKQSSPVDPDLCEWPEEYFADHIWFTQWPRKLATKTIAVDPSKGNDARRGDYSAIVMLGIDAAGVMYVDADLARRPTPRMVEDATRQCQDFRPHAFGVEANQFQELLEGEFAHEFRLQDVHIRPTAIHNHVNKLVRIRRLGPPLSQRRLRFLASSPSTRLLVDQLRDFPAAAHDDGPDALEMAMRLANALQQGYASDDGLGSRLPVG